MSPALADLSLKCVESAMQVSSIMKTFNAYNGPIPVPSFDAFVQADKLLQRSLKSGNGRQYEDALRAQRMFGNLLGNLLQLGCITFAPDSLEVIALVDYLRNSTESFEDLYCGSFHSEQEADKFAMSSVEPERPTLAIVVVNHLDIEGGNVDYKIWMNFTTVPSTWHSLHNKRKGLLTHYKHRSQRRFTTAFKNAIRNPTHLKVQQYRHLRFLHLRSQRYARHRQQLQHPVFSLLQYIQPQAQTPEAIILVYCQGHFGDPRPKGSSKWAGHELGVFV